MAVQKQDDQHEHTFSSYVRIRDVVLKTYLGRWTIGRSGERGSGISVLPARYDDDDDDFINCGKNGLSARTAVKEINDEESFCEPSILSMRVNIESVKIMTIWIEMLFYKY